MLALATLVAFVQFIQADTPLQPRTYASPSGEWSLSVDPSTRSGAGKSTLTIAKQGKVQWTGEKPFTFREAVINDSGVSAGVGYTEGGFSSDGSMVCAVVGSGGESLLIDETPRRGCRYPDGPSEPGIKQIILHPDRNIAVVSVAAFDPEREDEAWCVYQLAPAKKLDVVHAQTEFESPEEHGWTFALAAIHESPLTLAQWYSPGQWNVPGAGSGNRFALYDESWKLVWSLALPGDLALADDRAEWALFEEMRDHGAILDTKSARRFELRHVAKAERVTYEVSRDEAAPKGWMVREVARAPFKAESPETKPAELSKLELRALGTVKLDVGVADVAGPVRKIQAFTVGSNDQVTFVRSEEPKGAVTLVTLDATGKVLRQIAVPAVGPDTDKWSTWTALAGGDWLVTNHELGEDARSSVYRVNTETGVSNELPALEGMSLESVAPAADGGYAVLASHSGQYTMSSSVTRFSSEGISLWRVRESFDNESLGSLFSPEDVAVAADGSLLVVDNIRHLVQFFDARGSFVDAIELEKSWSSDFMYPTEVIPLPDHSAWVYDFHELTWHHLARDGKELARFAPHRANGDTDVGKSSDVRVDAHGHLWGCDEHEIFSFDDQGVAHTHFGAPPDPRRRAEPGQAFLDGIGRLVLEDDDTHALHVFTADGRRVLVCIPEPNDAEDSDSAQEVLAGPDGTLYAQLDRYEDAYLAFGADGKRIGKVELGGERVAFNRRTKERWALASARFENIRLRKFDAEGKVVFETDRRPDGGFFVDACAVACRPDGSVAVLDGSDGMWGGPGGLCLFGPKGEPLRQFKLPDNQLAFANRMQIGRSWIVISSHGSPALVVSVVDGKCYSFAPVDPEKERSLWGYGLSPDESELWALESESAVLHRFALPK